MTYHHIVTPLQDDSERPLLHSWSVPGVQPGSVLNIAARAGEVTTVVGANGAGKSALGMWLQQNSGTATVRRLIAHRKLWFDTDGPSITPVQRQATGQNMVTWSSQRESRWLDHAQHERTSILLFDLLAAMNSENRQIADLAASGLPYPEIEARTGPRLLIRLNAVLRGAGLPIQIKPTDAQTFHAINVTRGAEYPIFQMSDGEKSAVLLAVEILTAPEDCIQIIDEPERHLHRSISAGLIEAVIADRQDCHFVVLTHDLDLAATVGDERGTPLVLTDCIWAGETVSAWDLFEVGTSIGVPEAAQRAILGGRKDILFIEGDSTSVDVRLYGLLFPHWTLSPSGGASSVIRAVTGLTASQDHHWVRARGVVDGDGRSVAEQGSLAARGILSLPVSEVENLYYLDAVVDRMATVQATALGKSVDLVREDARNGILASLRSSGTLARLAGKLALSEVQRRIVDELPHELDGTNDPIMVSFASPYPRILAELQTLIDEEKVDDLVRTVPIRDTAVRVQVASALGYQKITDYESAVRVRISADDDLRTALQGIVGPIPVGA
jgi:ABC-type transport system involved in cytochrome c biogenesis ATPase subunit